MQCPTCLNPKPTKKPKKSEVERELAMLESSAAVLERKLHANLARQHALRRQLGS